MEANDAEGPVVAVCEVDPSSGDGAGATGAFAAADKSSLRMSL